MAAPANLGIVSDQSGGLRSWIYRPSNQEQGEDLSISIISGQPAHPRRLGGLKVEDITRRLEHPRGGRISEPIFEGIRWRGGEEFGIERIEEVGIGKFQCDSHGGGARPKRGSSAKGLRGAQKQNSN